MASTPDLASCISSNGDSTGGLSSTNPFYALRYQFGMLLGVDDFETEQAYYRGKIRLHNAWLHRAGTVWGLDVQLDTVHNEIQVLPGLALDPAGRELHLDATACVDVTKWYEAHKSDAGFHSTATATGGVQFDAYVRIAFQACLTRQVPAMTEPCQGAGATSTAYSRVSETVNLSLVPGKPDTPAQPYWRLRLLFWLDPPSPGTTLTQDAQDVVDARNQILALPAGAQPHAYLEAFRRFAALDEIDLRPATASDGSALVFPGADDTWVLLATIQGITLEKDGSGALALTKGTVDTTVRPVHVATATIEELLCGPQFADNPPTPAAQGPRIAPASVTVSGTTVTLSADSDVAAPTVQPPAFSATFLDANGTTPWQDLKIAGAVWAAPSKTITLTLGTAPGKGLLRLIAQGTGPMPLMGANSIPLGGSSAGADGRDFVWMQEVN
jgi:hypothetical protein